MLELRVTWPRVSVPMQATLEMPYASWLNPGGGSIWRCDWSTSHPRRLGMWTSGPQVVEMVMWFIMEEIWTHVPTCIHLTGV